MRIWTSAWALAVAAIPSVVAPFPAAAQDSGMAEADAVNARLDAIEERALAASATDDRPGAHAAYQELRAGAKAALPALAGDAVARELMRDRLAEAAMRASEYLDPATPADEAEMVALLVDAVENYALTQTGFDEDAQAYEWREAADQLFNWGLVTGDPRLADFSKLRVAANRERVKRFDRLLDGLAIEESYLANALIDHGWLTSDKAVLDEGMALGRRIGVDAVYDLSEKRDRIEQGRSPLIAPPFLQEKLDMAIGEIAALESDAIVVSLEEPVDHAKVHAAHLAVRDRAAPLIAPSAIDAEYQASLLTSAAMAEVLAADHLGATGDGMTIPDDPAVLRARAALYASAQERFARLFALGGEPDTMALTGDVSAGDSLFAIGVRINPPEWPAWSAARVAAKRRDLKARAEEFERNGLAMALFDHGWLTKDAAATAEAEAMLKALASNASFFLKQKAERIAAGKAPYDKDF